jgi:hypothetical protein
VADAVGVLLAGFAQRARNEVTQAVSGLSARLAAGAGAVGKRLDAVAEAARAADGAVRAEAAAAEAAAAGAASAARDREAALAGATAQACEQGAAESPATRAWQIKEMSQEHNIDASTMAARLSATMPGGPALSCTSLPELRACTWPAHPLP